MGGSFAPSISLGDVYVDSYRADIYLNGTLAEQFVYDISASGKYKMLYRSWKMPLSEQSMKSPYVSLLEISPPKGSVPYLKNWAGNVTPLSLKRKITQREFQIWPRSTRRDAYSPADVFRRKVPH